MTQTTWRPRPGNFPKPKRTRGQRIGTQERAWLVGRAQELRGRGVTLQDIADQLGISLAPAHRFARGEA